MMRVNELHSLQYLRAFAAIMVVHHHVVFQYTPYYPFLRETGSFGVDVFFIISGFVMIYADRPGDKPLAFLGRRLRRIAPLYWLFTLILAALMILRPDSVRTVTLSAEYLFKSLAFIPYSANGDLEAIYPLLIPGWTLNYELYFYLIFAMSLMMPQRFRIVAITLVLAGIALFSSAIAGESPLRNFYANTIIFEFVFGMLLAWLYTSSFVIPTQVARGLVVAALLLLFFEFGGARVIGYGIPALLLVTGAVYAKLPLAKVPALLGDASYSLYLSHMFTLGIVREVLPPMLGEGIFQAYAFDVISVLVCVVVGVGVYFVVERPLMKLHISQLLKKASVQTQKFVDMQNTTHVRK